MSYWSDKSRTATSGWSPTPRQTDPGEKGANGPGQGAPPGARQGPDPGEKAKVPASYTTLDFWPMDLMPGSLGSSGGGRRYSRYSGYSGPKQFDMNLIKNLLGRKPADYSAMQVPKYSAPEFYKFDGTAYAKARQALAESLSGDIQSGQAAYNAARTEMDALQGDPYRSSSSPYRTGRSIPQPAESALGRFGGAVDTSGAAAGDAAFANLRSILSGAHGQRQAAEARALSGDERRFMESLAAEGRMAGRGIEMAEVKAREAHRINEFNYGKDVADRIYEQQVAQAQADYAASSANTEQSNAYTQSVVNTLLSLITGGQKMDAAAINAILGGGE